MTTQEMTKQEMIMNLREKREEKKKAKLKAKHRRCTIAIITLVAMMTVIFGSVYSASAKEITITEINEFAGTNETKTVKTRSESVEGALEEHGVNVSDTDKINVSTEKPVEDNENIVIKRGKRVTIKVGESERRTLRTHLLRQDIFRANMTKFQPTAKLLQAVTQSSLYR